MKEMPEQTALRHGLEFLNSTESYGSEFVAMVKRDGEPMVLKKIRTDKQAFRGEASTLKHWGKTNSAAKLIDELEDGLLLIEFIDGKTLDNFTQDHDLGLDIGLMLDRIHVKPPRKTRSLEVHLQSDWESLVKDNDLFSEEVKDFAYKTMIRLVHAKAKPVLLHGDLRPTNIIKGSKGLRAIDPYGVSGVGEFDIGYYAASADSDNRWDLLDSLCTGYDRDTPLVIDAFVWNCVIQYAFYHRRHLPTLGLENEFKRFVK